MTLKMHSTWRTKDQRIDFRLLCPPTGGARNDRTHWAQGFTFEPRPSLGAVTVNCRMRVRRCKDSVETCDRSERHSIFLNRLCVRTAAQCQSSGASSEHACILNPTRRRSRWRSEKDHLREYKKADIRASIGVSHPSFLRSARERDAIRCRQYGGKPAAAVRRLRSSDLRQAMEDWPASFHRS